MVLFYSLRYRVSSRMVYKFIHITTPPLLLLPLHHPLHSWGKRKGRSEENWISDYVTNLLGISKKYVRRYHMVNDPLPWQPFVTVFEFRWTTYPVTLITRCYVIITRTIIVIILLYYILYYVLCIIIVIGKFFLGLLIRTIYSVYRESKIICSRLVV